MKTIKKRIIFIINALFVLFVIILIRIGYVQVFNGTVFVERAFDLWTRNIPVSGRRGRILDRNGKLIVGNTLAPTVSIIPQQIEDKERAIYEVSKILNMPMEKIAAHFNKNVSVEIIKPEGKNITLEQAKRIVEANIPGVYISSDVVRYYPHGNYLSHVLGIVGIDQQGITGLEYIYDDYLMGNIGSSNIFTDAHGNKIPGLDGNYSSPSKGIDLYLTIDLDVQMVLERVLDNAVSQYDPDEVFGIVMNPQTSEIIAMASRPNFDLRNYQDYDQEVFNRNLPIWKSFEPGSTFKFLTFAAGIEEGVFSPEDKFYDPGFAIVDGVRIRDWKAGGHGEQTYWEVIQNSCNPGFVEIGLRLGKEKLFKYIDDFGFGKKTGVDLLGESTGIVFDIDKIGNVELATSAFGQGNSTTPIQIINAASAAVNGGNLNTPYILKGFGIENTIIYQNDKKFVRRVISKETSDIIREALERVVALGTGRGAYIEGYRVGGKTGTAQIAVDGKYLQGEYILSFLGIAPMNHPELACYIGITKPKTYIQYGGTVVAPMVQEVLAESLNIMGIEKQPDGIPLAPRYWVDKATYKVENYIGKKRALITFHPFYRIKIEGNGDTIIAQIPEPGELIAQDDFVILYTD
ncbi:MAG TPA: stage V sporulation protein D [Acholeplasmataceae bacterium]|nr:stage V sporulation protein D [Acholeplasmataceae bacterium]